MIYHPPIFNPQGDDSLAARRIINGSTTNIMNLNNVRFKWASQLYQQMLENFWVPQKVDLTKDVNDYNRLKPGELRAFEGILSYLTYLDSIQTHNLPVLSTVFTAPEVTMCLAKQTDQEVIHNSSYQYIIETIIPSDRRNRIYDLWREDEILLKRSRLIAEVYQEYWHDNSEVNFFRSLCANYVLEGLYFYNGFVFFYNMASAARGKLTGCADMIRYIQRDEQTHVRLFQKILPEVAEELGFKLEDFLVPMIQEAVAEETLWAKHILGDVEFILDKNTEAYTHHLGNLRLRALGLEPVFPQQGNPYAGLEQVSDIDSTGSQVRGNFFETTVTSYNIATAVEGWEEAELVDMQATTNIINSVSGKST